jgi:imidazolonepropionase
MAELPPPTLIIRNISEVVTMADNDQISGAKGQLARIERAAIVATGELITFVGPEIGLANISFATNDGPPPIELDAGGKLVTPGLVDAHTHLIFAGDRSGEFQLRHAGASYEEIQTKGGGIRSTMRATRAANDTELLALAEARLRSMRAHGTTTVEAKSGYGLDRPTEEKLLRLANICNELPGAPQVIPTFLGAHVIPPEYHKRNPEYIALLTEEWLPAFKDLARFCDVFCERTAFSPDETRAILVAAREQGYLLKIHAEQLSASGGAALAAEFGAISADHLDHTTDEDLDKLADAGVVAVLLPGCSFSLNTPYPQARRIFEHGLKVALATDFNPGTSYCENLQFMASLAVAHMGMRIDEALLAITRRGAEALALFDRGIIAPGMRCDLAIWQIPRYHEIAYHFGVNLIARTIISGQI